MTYGTRAWKLICKWYRSVLNHERLMTRMRQWGQWGQEVVASPSHLEQLEPRLMLSGTPTIQVDVPAQVDEGAPIQIDFAAVPESLIELDLSPSPTFSAYHQDRAGSTGEVRTDDGEYIYLDGDVWKKISFPYTVTANTILEFEFKSTNDSTNEGQIYGIGFDTNNVINAGACAFQLWGEQSASSLVRASVDPDIDEYAGDGTWQYYRIRVGDRQTGTMSYMTFFAEDDGDGSIGNATSMFRNIRVYDEVTATGWSVDWGDGDSDTYAAGAASATHTYAQDSTAEASGHYDLVVTATVAGGDVDSDPVEITVNNVPPRVAIDPGSLPSAIYQGTEVTLGSTVTDPGADSLTYAWSVTKDGNPYSLTGITTNGESLTFTPDGLGSYAVTLTVSDGLASVSRTHFLLLVDPDVVAESRTGIEMPEGTTCSLSVHSRPYGADPVDFSTASFSSYGVGQDGQNGLSTVAEYAPAPDYDDMEVRIAGNAWKSIPFNYTVTADTMLEFRFKSTELGEIHGIGLDSDASQITGKRLFEIYGNDTSGNFWKDDSWKYTDEDLDGYVLFRIPVGEYFTGQMDRMTFVCDDDVDQDPTDPDVGLGDSWFKDVRVYERYDPESWTVNWGDGTPAVEPDGSVGAVSHTYTDDSKSEPEEAYQIQVTAHFTQGDVVVPPIAITVTNAAPVVEIDASREVTYGTEVVFAADASDPGTGDTLSYSWAVSCNGEPVSLEGITSDQSTLTMTLSEVGVWEVWATVDDGDEDGETSAKHYVTVPGVAVTSEQATVDAGDAYTIDFDFIPEGSAPVDVSATTQSSYFEDGANSDWEPIVEDGWVDGVAITGNAWKKIAFPYTVTANTVLEFEFKSDHQGEVHGIGLDENNTCALPARNFQLYGTQYANSFFQEQAGGPWEEYSGSGWQSYSIPVGQYFTSTVAYMTFSADDDSSEHDGDSQFRNIRVYEKYDATGWTVNWGDGTQVSLGALADAGSHEYQNAGTYNVVVTRHSATGDVVSPAMTVTVKLGNTPPHPEPDGYTTSEDQVLSVVAAGVLTNDTDAENDPLTAVLVSDASHGTVSLLPNGSFTYTPDTDYFGTDSFTYRANDGTLDGDPTTVSLTIESVAMESTISRTDSLSSIVEGEDTVEFTATVTGATGDPADTSYDWVVTRTEGTEEIVVATGNGPDFSFLVPDNERTIPSLSPWRMTATWTPTAIR